MWYRFNPKIDSCNIRDGLQAQLVPQLLRFHQTLTKLSLTVATNEPSENTVNSRWVNSNKE